MTITVANKSEHDQKIRRAHINAISVLRKEIEKDHYGTQVKTLLEKSEAYHLACLHRRWFSIGRRETEEKR